MATDEEPTKRDQRRLEDLRASNQRRESDLKAQGVRFEPSGLIGLQANVLRRLWIGDDPAKQLAYDIAYQEELAAQFDRIDSEIGRAKLTAGLHMPNGVKSLRG